MGTPTVAGEESVDLVDEGDAVFGSSTLSECLKKGLLHRAVAVVVTREDGVILLQKRSKIDQWQPGKWTLSCTGHVKLGESYEAAAGRELNEELGLAGRLNFLEKRLLPPITEGELTEREWVALYTITTDSPARINPVELESVEEFTRAQVRRMLGGDEMTPDAVDLLSRYLHLRPPDR